MMILWSKPLTVCLHRPYRNFEFIIVLNGASNFNNYHQQKYTDSRIVFIEFEKNQGSYWGVEISIKKNRPANISLSSVLMTDGRKIN